MTTYKDAGVDIEAGEEFVKLIKPLAESTHKEHKVLGSLGGFAGMYELGQYHEPVLVSCSDGVGSKILFALQEDEIDYIGEDLVAMSVNDLICCGAKPLFFLDYIAVGKLMPEYHRSLVTGIATGCRLAGCALLGGETAEVPALYSGNHLDLAGFAVGVVEKSEIIDGSSVKAGDVLVGMHSSGMHSNGYSLLWEYRDKLKDFSVVDLLEPTEIYVDVIRDLLKEGNFISAMAHITGGGVQANVARVIPDGLRAVIDRKKSHVPKLFLDIQNRLNIDTEEMYRVFNMGIGFVLVVKKKELSRVQQVLTSSVDYDIIGEVEKT